MFLLICACFPGRVYAAQNNTKNRGAMVTTQLLGGYLVSVVAGIAIGLLMSRIMLKAYPSGWLGAFFLGFISGATPAIILASAGSVYGIGKAWKRMDGSFGKTLLGAAIPPLIGAIIGSIAIVVSWDLSEMLVFILIGAFLGSLLSPIGATIAYQCRHVSNLLKN